MKAVYWESGVEEGMMMLGRKRGQEGKAANINVRI